tara:strand:- start:1263 stop:1718 length:456 start_codon:yes stop_codon:yes gene_type:complete
MVYSVWIDILMGVYGDMPGAGLTALLQDRKEKTMSKEEDKLNLDLSKYESAGVDTITVSDWQFNGIKSSDITVTVDGKLLKEVENDFLNTDVITVTPGSHGDYSSAPITINTDVKQGDLFNGWPEDGKPDPDARLELNEESGIWIDPWNEQ